MATMICALHKTILTNSGQAGQRKLFPLLKRQPANKVSSDDFLVCKLIPEINLDINEKRIHDAKTALSGFHAVFTLALLFLLSTCSKGYLHCTSVIASFQTTDSNSHETTSCLERSH